MHYISSANSARYMYQHAIHGMLITASVRNQCLCIESSPIPHVSAGNVSHGCNVLPLQVCAAMQFWYSYFKLCVTVQILLFITKKKNYIILLSTTPCQHHTAIEHMQFSALLVDKENELSTQPEHSQGPGPILATIYLCYCLWDDTFT